MYCVLPYGFRHDVFSREVYKKLDVVVCFTMAAVGVVSMVVLVGVASVDVLGHRWWALLCPIPNGAPWLAHPSRPRPPQN